MAIHKKVKSYTLEQEAIEIIKKRAAQVEAQTGVRISYSAALNQIILDYGNGLGKSK